LRRYTPGADHLPGALDDAADEITRLRAEVERLRMTDAELDEVEKMIANYCAVADSQYEPFRYGREEEARRHGRNA
jgi:hypothetical protein